MPLLDELMRQSPLVQSVLQQRVREREGIKKEREEFLADPSNAEKLIAKWQHQSLPELKAAKISLGSPLEKIEKGIPKDDPRRLVGRKTLQESMQAIAASPGRKPADVVAELYNANYAEAAGSPEQLYNYIFKKESSLTSGKAATAPGYEDWKQEKLARHKEENSVFTNPAVSFGLGTAFSLAGAGLGLLAGKSPTAARIGWGLGAKLAAKVAGQSAPKILGKAAVAGLTAVPTFAAFDLASAPVRRSQWAAANPGLALIPEAAAGIAGMSAGTKIAGKIFNRVLEKPIEGVLDDAFSSLSKDSSIGNLLKFSDTTKVAETVKTATVPRPESWTQAARNEVFDLTESGMAVEDAVKQVSEKLIVKQGLVDTLSARKEQLLQKEAGRSALNDRVNAMQKLFPELSQEELLVKTLEAPGVEEATRKVLLEKGMSNSDITGMPVWKQLKTASVLDQQKRPLEKLVGTEQRLAQEATAKELTAKSEQIVAEHMSKPAWDHSDAELLAKRTSLRESYEQGLLSSKQFRELDRRYKIVDAPKTERELFSASGIEVAKTAWIDSAKVHLDEAVKAGSTDKWNSIIQHFVDNFPKGLSSSSKGATAFRDMVKGFKDSKEFSALYEKDKENITKLYSRIVYGNPDKEILAMARKEAKTLPKDEFLKKYSGNAGKFLGVSAVTGLGMTAIGSFLSPGEAEAGMIDTAAKIVPRMLREMQAVTGKSVKEVATQMYEAGYAYPERIANTFRLRTQKFWGMTPAIEDISRKERIPWFQSIMTPGGIGQVLFKGWASPQPQAAYMTTMAHNNATEYIRLKNDILKLIPGYKNSTKEVTKFMEPIAKKYGSKMTEAKYLEQQIKNIDDAFAGKYSSEKESILSLVNKAAKRGKLDQFEQEQLNTLKEAKKHFTELRKGYDDIVQSFSKDIDAAHKTLAQKYSSSRVALAVEDVGMTEADPWLRNMLTKEEQLAVSRFRDIEADISAEMIRVGERPMTSQMHIYHASHPSIEYKDLLKDMKKIVPDAFTGTDMAHFHHRASWSKQLMPDIDYVMEKYLPDASMRIGMAEFWNTWLPFKNKVDMLGYKGVSDYLGALQKGFRNTDQWGTVNMWAQRIQMFEVARLISLSPSVALKHGFKVLANVANYGFKNALVNVPRDMSAFIRNTKMDLGYLPKDHFDAVMKGHINTRRIYTLANDMAMYGVPKQSMDKYLEKWNDVGSFMLNASERFDRGTSFLNAMTMASKQGMTPEQASYLVMDAVLKNNFLSGIHNPSWLRDPKTRLLFLFQGTPFKLAEQRALTAMRGSGAVADAAKETWTQLQNLKKDLVQGTKTFKAHLIKDALMNPKDLAGNSYAAQLIRNILVIGATVEGGKYVFDADMWGMFHTPFFKHNEQSISMAVNPMFNAALQARSNEEEEVYWTTDFLRKWVSTGGPNKLYFGPASTAKLGRITADDIPEIYRESKLRYLFGLPAAKEEE